MDYGLRTSMIDSFSTPLAVTILLPIAQMVPKYLPVHRLRRALRRGLAGTEFSAGKR